MKYFQDENFCPETVLDIGCNRGKFYQFCKRFWPFAQYTLIDANPRFDAVLNAERVEHYIAVLSDEVKTVDFYYTKLHKANTGASMYREDSHFFADENLVTKSVVTTTLDMLLKDRKFDLIKMDTQGSELDIIKGGMNVCRSAKYIILEVSLLPYNIGAPLFEDVKHYMEANSFSYVAKIAENVAGCGPFVGQMCQNDVVFKNMCVNDKNT